VKKIAKKSNADDDPWTEQRSLKYDGKSASNGLKKNYYST